MIVEVDYLTKQFERRKEDALTVRDLLIENALLKAIIHDLYGEKL